MSLRAFHLFFIIVSSLLCAFLILWGVYDFKISGGARGLSLSGVGAVGLFLLTRYFRWFRQKVLRIWPMVVSTLFGSLLWGRASWVEACAVCYKDPSSPLTKGAFTGVSVLLGVIVTVLTLIVLVARSWVKRAKTLAQDF